MAHWPMAKKKHSCQPKFYSKGRVKRGPAPSVVLKRTTYRKALPELRRDFDDRCAYCMRRIGTKSDMHIDHFDPRKKNDKIQVYANLFLSDEHCNCAKSNMWPTDEEIAQGYRFLNCCEEVDYGNVIFEDPKTHELVGTTSAAIYHIEAIDLNDPGLIAARKSRSEVANCIRFLQARLEKDLDVAPMLARIQAEASNSIPSIPAPPRYWTMMD